MKYFIVSLFVVIYFEVLGQYLQKRFNINALEIGLGFGLIAFLAFAYITTSILTALNCNFLIVIIIYSMFFLASLFFILKDIKKIKYRFTWLHLIMAVLMVVFIYYSSEQSLGDLNGFDTTYYLNMVSTNANLTNLNCTDMLFGGYHEGHVSYQYSFQSFYYFASYVVFFATKLLGMYPATTYIWAFQTLFYAFIFSLILNSYRKFANKKYLILVVSIILLGFYFTKLYFNSVFGFYGNSYRIVGIGYVSLFIIDYFKNNSIENKTLVSLAILSACSVSSTSLFIVVIMLYSLFIVNIKNDCHMLKWIALTLLIPVINLISVLLYDIPKAILVTTPVFIIVFLVGDKIEYLIRKYKINYALLAISVVFMAFMTYKTSGTIFNIDIFANNLSETADMTINYINLNNSSTIKIIYIVIFVVSFVISIIFDRNNKLLLLMLVVFAVFLSPWGCAFFYSINKVFHRTWDIIINPCTYVYVLTLMCQRIKNKKLEQILLIIISIVSILNIDFLNPTYYHETFEIDDEYNKLYKMSNNEFDVIEHLNEDIKNNNVENPAIVTQNLLTESMIPNGKYTYGRGLRLNPKWSKDEYQIYAIFFEEQQYKGFYQPKDKDIDNVEKYIKNAGIDYLVLEKDWSYLDSKTNAYKPLMYKIDEFKFPFYENDEYVIYHFDK